MTVKRSIGALVLLVVACGGAPQNPAKPRAPQTNQQPVQQEKADFKALLAREANGLKEHDVAGEANAWTARILAAASPTVTQSEGISLVEIPIGSHIPIHCQVFPQDIDAASTLGQVLERVTQSMEVRAVAPWNITVLRETPAAFIDVLYHANTPRGKAAGELKVGLHPAPGMPVLCLHEELGYKKTFEQVMASFATSLETTGKPPPAPEYVEVQTLKVLEQPVGFQKRFYEREGAEAKFTTVGSLFLPIAPTNLRLTDGYTIEVIDRNGRLSRATYVEAQGGEIDLNVTIERKKGSVYQYHGDAHGKHVQGEFKVNDAQGLASAISTAQRLARETLKGTSFSFKEAVFMPNIDPEKPVEVTYSRDKTEGPPIVHVETDGLSFSGQVDEQGFFEAFQFPVGNATLTTQRTFVRGKI